MAEHQNPALALLSAARTALGDQSPFPADRRARAAATLTRAALEHEIDEWLNELGRARGAGAHGTRIRWASKLVALRVLDGTPASREATYAWNALSSACHHHAYNLSATVAEVSYLTAIVEEIVDHRE